jgi:hypothetical protein
MRGILERMSKRRPPVGAHFHERHAADYGHPYRRVHLQAEEGCDEPRGQDRGHGIDDALCLDGQLDPTFERKPAVHRYPRRRMRRTHRDRGSESHHRCVEDVHVHRTKMQSRAKLIGVIREL